MAVPRRSNPAAKSGFSIRLGVPGLAALAVLVVVGMVWSFILGVVVGRGHHPERVVEEVVRQALPPQDNASENATVLRPEELQFFEKLHRMPVAEAVPAPQTPPKEQKAASAPSAAANATAAAKPKAEKKTPATNATAAKPPAAPSVPPLAAQPQAVFEYQLAALDKDTDADAMVRRLRAAGIDARVNKATSQGKTWYRVLVRHHGTVETALVFKENLQKSGFRDIVLRSKQPITTPQN